MVFALHVSGLDQSVCFRISVVDQIKVELDVYAPIAWSHFLD